MDEVKLKEILPDELRRFMAQTKEKQQHAKNQQAMPGPGAQFGIHFQIPFIQSLASWPGTGKNCPIFRGFRSLTTPKAYQTC